MEFEFKADGYRAHELFKLNPKEFYEFDIVESVNPELDGQLIIKPSKTAKYLAIGTPYSKREEGEIFKASPNAKEEFWNFKLLEFPGTVNKELIYLEDWEYIGTDFVNSCQIFKNNAVVTTVKVVPNE